MKPGGSKSKGSAFERSVGRSLSLWLTQGARADLFARSVLSGGQFTNALKKGGELNVAGDLMAAHPLAFDFMKCFSVECKHYRDLNVEALIYGAAHQSFLGQVYKRTEKDGAHLGTLPFVVAKQNHRNALALMPPHVVVGREDWITTRLGKLNYHVLHCGYILLADFEAFLSVVRPDAFLRFAADETKGNDTSCKSPPSSKAPSKPLRLRRTLLAKPGTF